MLVNVLWESMMCLKSNKFKVTQFEKPIQIEIKRLIEELVRIGIIEDFLSERPGGAFDQNCRHKNAREIGGRLDRIGSTDLMQYAFNRAGKKFGRKQTHLLEHLGYCWNQIGKWKY